ncbi:MAG: regulatory protein RecX [Candidatus Reddybacter sp.]
MSEPVDSSVPDDSVLDNSVSDDFLSEQPEPVKPVSAKNLRLGAMNILARREHSRKEVRDKLLKKFDPSAELLDAVLDKLVVDDLLSDQRFSEAFVRWRVGKGQGAVRIRMELRERGVDGDAVLRECDVDWFALAVEVAHKRFGASPAIDPKQRAKRMRFLQYRGFNGEQIRAALHD